jgi:acetylornithine deacetylase/succinyl-diaminopimelate desuccinylase-like protein
VGGTVFGMAPGEVEIWIDRRVTPDETLEDAKVELDQLLSDASWGPGTAVSGETVRLAEPMRPSPGQEPFVKILTEESQAVTGLVPPRSVSTLYTDARWFSNAGFPTIMYGAGESDITISRANGGDERVPEQCLGDATAILARAITRYIMEGHSR